MQRTVKSALVALVILVSLPGGLLAAGFGIYEQSAKASGLAGAWVARADDAAANWYNPAALVWLDGSELQFGTNIINTGDSELTSSDPAFGLFQPTTFEQESNLATPSHLYYRHKINNNLAFGVGVNTPYGLVTEWVDRPITFSAAKSDLATIFINPNLAFRLTESWSVAVGLSYVFADLKDFSREIPIDLDANPLNGFEVIGFSNLSGDGDDFGWNAALHHKRGNFSFGLSYRSDVTVEIDGDIAFSDFGPLAGFFRSSPGTADLELPETIAIGVAWQGPRWGIELDLVQVGWSVFDVLVVDIENNLPGFVDDIALVEDWDDSDSIRIGLSRKLGPRSELRFGLNLEDGAVPEDTLRPSIPDADRVAPSVGYGFAGKKWAVDVYAQTFIFDDITAVAGEEGVIVADYDSGITLFGFTFGRKF
ncbi:MAG: outer membrane protein transport protein [Acidobacteriota bacterium]